MRGRKPRILHAWSCSEATCPTELMLSGFYETRVDDIMIDGNGNLREGKKKTKRKRTQRKVQTNWNRRRNPSKKHTKPKATESIAPCSTLFPLSFFFLPVIMHEIHTWAFHLKSAPLHTAFSFAWRYATKLSGFTSLGKKGKINAQTLNAYTGKSMPIFGF